MTDEKAGMSTKMGVTLLVVGGYVTAMSLGAMNAVGTTGARWAWGAVLWVGLMLLAWPILEPWDGKKKG